MTKKLLLAAAAVSAIGFAGAANAQVITSATVSTATVKAAGASAVTPYTIANESVASVANRRTTTAPTENVVAFTVNPTAAAVPVAQTLELGTTYRITYTLSGTANPTFLAQVTSGALTMDGNAACVIPTTVATGTGAGGSNTVSFIVRTVSTFGAGCATAADLPGAFSIDLPFQIATVGTVTATVSGALDASNTNPAASPDRFTAAGSSIQLVQASAGYRIFADATVDNVSGDGVDNADLPTTLALETTGAPFRSFNAAGDRVIGGAGFVLATPPANAAAAAPAPGSTVVRANLANVSMPAPTYALTISPTSGDFSALKPQVGTSDNVAGFTDATVAANLLSATAGTTTAPAAGAQNIALRVEGTPTASISNTPLTFTATVRPVAPAANSPLVTPPAAITNAPLETVGLQGSTFIAPWVQSSNANYNTVIRISNNGGMATGSVQLSLASPLNTPTASVCTAAQLPKLASIPANGELALNSADLTTCFGAFGRGDVSATVLSLDTNLTAKLRIVSPGNVVTEQSLGRF